MEVKYLEKDYRKEKFTMTQIRRRYSNFKSTTEFNKFLENLNFQYRDKLGVWRFRDPILKFEYYTEKEINSVKKVLVRLIEWQGVCELKKILRAHGRSVW